MKASQAISALFCSKFAAVLLLLVDDVSSAPGALQLCQHADPNDLELQRLCASLGATGEHPQTVFDVTKRKNQFMRFGRNKPDAAATPDKRKNQFMRFGRNEASEGANEAAQIDKRDPAFMGMDKKEDYDFLLGGGYGGLLHDMDKRKNQFMRFG